MRSTVRRAGAVLGASVALLVGSPSLPAHAETPAVGSAADAYGLDVDVTLTIGGVHVDQGPLARSSQEYPPTPAQPVDEHEVVGTGQIPAGGAVVEDIGVLSTAAVANAAPAAAALAVAENVELINQGGTPLLTARTLVAQSTTTCTDAPTAEGTTFADIKVGGVAVPDQTPAPNTPLADAVFNPLGLRVILNEQHPTADGRGLVVNAIHIMQFGPSQISLFTGDVIVSHAMSTVHCPNGVPGSTGGDNDITIVKNADKALARPGETVTYTATITNNSDEVCLVNEVTDHLPVAFEYASTSGALGTVATAVARPSGGQDVVIRPTGVTIPTGGSITQTYVVTVKDDAAPGTYFNNVELLCGNLGNWVKGLDAPVTVPGDEPPPTTPPTDKPQCDDGKDNDGDGKVDFPADPGCLSKKDDDEIDLHPHTGGSGGYLPGTVGVVLLAGAYAARRRRPAC